MTQPERIEFSASLTDAMRLRDAVEPLGAKVGWAHFERAPDSEHVTVDLPDDPEKAEQVRRLVEQAQQQSGS